MATRLPAALLSPALRPARTWRADGRVWKTARSPATCRRPPHTWKQQLQQLIAQWHSCELAIVPYLRHSTHRYAMPALMTEPGTGQASAATNTRMQTSSAVKWDSRLSKWAGFLAETRCRAHPMHSASLQVNLKRHANMAPRTWAPDSSIPSVATTSPRVRAAWNFKVCKVISRASSSWFKMETLSTMKAWR